MTNKKSKIKFKIKNKSRKCLNNIINCETHNIKVDFICTRLNCLKILCCNCILLHKQHFYDIKTIKNTYKFFIEEFKNDYKNVNNKESQINNNYNIDITFDSIKNILNEVFIDLKYDLSLNLEYNEDTIDKKKKIYKKQ